MGSPALLIATCIQVTGLIKILCYALNVPRLVLLVRVPLLVLVVFSGTYSMVLYVKIIAILNSICQQIMYAKHVVKTVRLAYHN